MKSLRTRLTTEDLSDVRVGDVLRVVRLRFAVTDVPDEWDVGLDVVVQPRPVPPDDPMYFEAAQ